MTIRDLSSSTRRKGDALSGCSGIAAPETVIEERHKLRDYRLSQDLGREEELLVVVKHQGQPQANRRFLRHLQRQGTSLGLSRRRPLRRGMAFLVRVAGDRITGQDIEQAPFLVLAKEPRALACQGNRIAVASANELVVFDWSSGQLSRWRDPWFDNLHSVFFSSDGRRLLVTATGFDAILEVDATSGAVLWRWCAWDHGWTLAPNGRCLTRDPVLARELRRQGKPVILLDSEHPFALDRRRSARGGPVPSRPCHLNGAIYGKDDKILATLFHQGQVLAIDRGGRAEIRYAGLLNPHGLAPDPEGGYIVTDTHKGRFLSFSPELALLREIDCAGLPDVVPGMESAGEWLQCVTALGEGRYAAADSHRSAILLLDVRTRLVRSLKVPRSWGVQMVVRAPAGLAAACRARRIEINCYG